MNTLVIVTEQVLSHVVSFLQLHGVPIRVRSLSFFFHPIPQNLSFQKARSQNPWGTKIQELAKNLFLLLWFFLYLGTTSFSLSSISTVCLLSDTEGFLEMLDVI